MTMKKTARSTLLNQRRSIDRIDSTLLALLNKRALVVEKIQAIKSQQGLGVHDPLRETQILNRLYAENRGPLTEREIAFIFRKVLYLFRSRQRTRKKGSQKSR
jgi:3-deoxy-7-phosphoheptulonate synthase/chorismate mutase